MVVLFGILEMSEAEKESSSNKLPWSSKSIIEKPVVSGIDSQSQVSKTHWQPENCKSESQRIALSIESMLNQVIVTILFLAPEREREIFSSGSPKLVISIRSSVPSNQISVIFKPEYNQLKQRFHHPQGEKKSGEICAFVQ